MTKTYTRLTWTDRLNIEKLFNAGTSYRAMSRKLGFSPSALHYEIHRGLYDHLDGSSWKTVKRYSADIAQADAEWQATVKGCPIKLGRRHDCVKSITSRIHSGESPDQIVGDLKRQNQWIVSTSTLYRYIDQGYIPDVTNKNLWQKSKRKKRRYHKVRAARAPRGVSIERRPQAINDRTIMGHWEMDSVVGKSKGKR